MVQDMMKVAPHTEKLREYHWDSHVGHVRQQDVGSPRKRWLETLMEDMKKAGVSLEDGLKKKTWRQRTRATQPNWQDKVKAKKKMKTTKKRGQKKELLVWNPTKVMKKKGGLSRKKFIPVSPASTAGIKGY